MKNLLANLFLFLMLSVSVEATEPFTAYINSYSKISNQNIDPYFIVNVVLENGSGTDLTIRLEKNQVQDFQVSKDSTVLLLDEKPGALVGWSNFSVQFENNSQIYEATGPSLQLTAKDWGLDNKTVMVTSMVDTANFHTLIINGDKEIPYVKYSGYIVGKVFKLDMKSETPIPDNQGNSYFTYRSVNDGNFFITIAPSVAFGKQKG
jgi:hypothetical protein